MAGERVVPGLSGLIKAFFTPGSDGWDDEMDVNLRALASLTQLCVLSRVTSDPGSPANGDIHIHTAGGHANQVAIRDNGAWVYFTPTEGWGAWDRATNEPLRFDGASWTLAAAGLVDAPADGDAYVRKDNVWEPLDDFLDGQVEEAPGDGEAYVRKDDDWVLLTDILAAEDVVIDAPSDGKHYARSDAAWEEIVYAYDYAIPCPTEDAASTYLPIVRDHDLADNFAGCRFHGAANATASTVFTIKLNGATLGTCTIAAGTVTPTFVTSGSGVEQLDDGDLLEITGPATADVTLTQPVITFKGVRRL